MSDGEGTNRESSAPAPAPAPASLPWIRLVELSGANPSEDTIKGLVYEQLLLDLSEDPTANNYTVLFLYDRLAIARPDTDFIYRAIGKAPRDKPLLLILDSNGGDIAAAYFIAKICREFTEMGFQVAVPRRAKSAATLICCGAERIHMGSLSELGPIDPQFGGGVPALALKNSIEHLAELTKRHPQATELFSSYLAKTLRIESLGYYERVAESAAQYAERLLRSRRLSRTGDEKVRGIASRLVYMYKDHGFVIDAAEATEIFGEEVVLNNTPEYQLANRLYRSLDIIERVLGDLHSLGFAFTGSPTGGCQLRKLPRPEAAAS